MHKTYKGMRILGLGFIIAGCVLALNAASPTGFFILEDMEPGASSFLGFLLVAIGLVFFSVAHSLDTRLQYPAQHPVHVLISKRALERLRKDKQIRAHEKEYLKEITMIAANPSQRPQELIGDFHVSPRGHNPLRVAWRYDSKSNTIKIDDFLLHETDRRYTDGWNEKAGKGIIRKELYESYGYEAA